MQATLTFDLHNEESEFYDALDGTDWKLVAQALDEWLRQMIKYNDRSELQSARDELNKIVVEHGLNLW